MMANLSDEDRKKAREAMQKALAGKQMQDLTPEERQKVLAEVRKAVPAMAAAGGRPQGAAGQGGPGGGGRGGFGGMPMTGPGGFSERELQSAQLPPPVDPENQLDVLLRPGLLADVEIILERFPDAINVPSQAVFEKDGKPIVYVRANNRWEEREIKPVKRSESVMVISSGVKAGETIAVADPLAKPGAKKADKPAGGSAVGSLPGGRS